MLLKINKINNPGRPVVGRCHSTNISKFVDYHLQRTSKKYLLTWKIEMTFCLNKIDTAKNIPANSNYGCKIRVYIPNSEGISAVKAAHESHSYKSNHYILSSDSDIT